MNKRVGVPAFEACLSQCSVLVSNDTSDWLIDYSAGDWTQALHMVSKCFTPTLHPQFLLKFWDSLSLSCSAELRLRIFLSQFPEELELEYVPPDVLDL